MATPREVLLDLRSGVDPRLPKPGTTQVHALLDQYERSLVQRGVVNRRHNLSTLRRNRARHKARPIGDLRLRDAGLPGQGFRLSERLRRQL
jgi:hypothetical protein